MKSYRVRAKKWHDKGEAEEHHYEEVDLIMLVDTTTGRLISVEEADPINE